MSDMTNTSAVETTTSAPVAATSAAPAKVRKAPAKATKAPARATKSNGDASTLTGVQHRTLAALLKADRKGPMSRKQIMEAAFGGNSVNMRPILDALTGAKLVKENEVDVDGRTEHLIGLTAAGRKAAAKAPPVRATRSAAEHKPLPKVGGSFTREYKGKTYTVKVLADGFQVGPKKYPSLTAAAKGVRGSDTEVNGWLFFGLAKG